MGTLTLIGKGGHGTDIAASLKGVDFDWVRHHRDRWDRRGDYILGINDPHMRAEVCAEIMIQDQKWVHPDAKVYGDSLIRSGAHVNYGVTMTRTDLGVWATISPGVTICGDVRIGNRTLIGAGATIGDRVTIGDDVTVGMGAVVLPETVIPDGETWVGVPARKLR